MRRRLLFPLPILTIAATAFAQSQPAAQQDKASDLTVAGVFYSTDHHNALFVATSKPSGTLGKGAVVGIEYEKSGDNYMYNGTYGKLIAVFTDAASWRKFVKLWEKARAAPKETDDGYYFDGQTELGVGQSHDGELTFTWAGGGANENNTPRDIKMFVLPPKDVAAFARTVRQVSVYFAK